MSQGILSSNLPGYGPATASSYGDLKAFLPVKINLSKNVLLFSNRASSIVCSANSSNHRRNPDFSRQRQNHGFSRNRNRQNLDRDSSENIEESELLSSKNGPLLSLSSGPRFQATATPGPREKEIVDLFRKVQAQLRERAAIKEEKKMESSQGQGKESETVDSLLKLLRKHSVDQGKRKSNSVSSRDFVLEQPEQNVSSFEDEQNTNFLNSNSNASEEEEEDEEAQEPKHSNPFRRPASNFRRKSPVPRMKYEPVYSPRDNENSLSSPKLQGRRNKNEPEPELETEPVPDSVPEFEPVSEIELESELEESFDASSDVHDEEFAEISEIESSDVDEAYIDDEVVETKSATEHTDLSALKLAELKVLAKSRGLKGYSKLKKVELIELLCGN
ncbi:hypothetical protein MKW94_025682 [Papaver nudicaule]|uniref:Rho termination factor-like N-terminal domain-containing protein n=1 Tax=Papaver nudicaule TaxID=74823 RepID=A0AA41V6J4_PAPNU|nr:hypothetical protein [Papaver nudicaule]